MQAEGFVVDHASDGEAGHVVGPETIAFGDYVHKSGYLAMEQLIKTNPNLDGVFVANDQMAIGVSKYLQRHKRNIPDDVKVIGFDDVFVSSLVNPSLSSIHIDKKRMGMRASQVLIEKIERLSTEDEAEVFREELETPLVVRASTMSDFDENWTLFDW